MRLAGLQHGLVTREQLIDAGFGRAAIRHRVAQGRLTRLYPAVYRVGPDTQARFAPEMAAVLNYRGHAVLSHRTAAVIWGLIDLSRCVTLTLVHHSMRARPGLTLHRTIGLERQDLRTLHGLPLTSPARTLLDLAGVVSDGELDEAVARALHRRKATTSQIEDVLARAATRKGAAKLRQALGHPTGYTEAKGERALFALLKAAGLPLPVTQVPILGHRVDFLWPAQRLIVEIDGYEFHGGRDAFEADRARDQTLLAAGYRVIRITYRQLEHAPLALAARLAQALIQRG